jgi:hypothetical protein
MLAGIDRERWNIGVAYLRLLEETRARLTSSSWWLHFVDVINFVDDGSCLGSVTISNTSSTSERRAATTTTTTTRRRRWAREAEGERAGGGQTNKWSRR